MLSVRLEAPAGCGRLAIMYLATHVLIVLLMTPVILC